MAEPTETEQIEFEVLDILVDGEFPFLEIYRSLERSEGFRGIDISKTLDILHQMRQRGWLHEWLMDENAKLVALTEDQRLQALSAYEDWLPREDISNEGFDKVGLWYEITDEGRLVWKSRLPVDYQPPPLWPVHPDDQNHTITIYADTVKTADEALADWLRGQRQVIVDTSSKRIEGLDFFRLHDGRLIQNGVKVVYHMQNTD